jgi:uncharacterized protein DUF6597
MTDTAIPTDYVEHAPPAALREYVECFWTRGESPADATKHHILPDGCIDIVLCYRSGAAGENPSATLAVGTMTRPLSVAASEAAVFVGARFWPGRALPFLGVPASAITDLRVDVGDLWPRRSEGLANIKSHELGAWRLAFERLLLRRLDSARPVDVTVDAALGAILRAGGNLSITSLAPPKMFARVARVRRVLAKARVATRVDWSALALDAGFYDQAHLSGEIRELSGRTPTEWVASD